MKKMADSGAPFSNVVAFCNSFQKQKFSEIYSYVPTDRTTGGSNIQTILTDFGPIRIAFDRFMPAASVLFADIAYCAPVFLEIPGKGLLFREPLAKTGSADKEQIYGEMGLMYGPELWHGKLTGLATS